MKTITATMARENIYKLMDETYESHEPIQITGKRHSAVLLSETDWNAIQETLYLMNIPGMTDSIIEGMNTPIEECVDLEDIKW